MLFLTKGFIENVHDAFDELNYHVNKSLNYNDFIESAIDTLCRCKELSDVRECVNIFQFCNTHWNDIEKVFDKKLAQFNLYGYEGNSLLELLKPEECGGGWIITNGINKNGKDIIVASWDLEGHCAPIDFEQNIVRLSSDSDYYIKPAKMSSVKMKLFDRNNKCLCNIVLSENLGFFLENNITPYELVIFEDCVGIFDKSYLDSKSEDDDILLSDAVAMLEWDVLDEKSKLGVAFLNFFKDCDDIELPLLFATSTFLLFKRYIDAESRSRILYLTMMNNAARRR